MNMDLAAIFLIALMIISAFGASSINMNEADKAELATKPPLYQGFIALCRRLWIIMIAGVVLFMLSECVGRSDRVDCDYSRNGAICSPS